MDSRPLFSAKPPPRSDVIDPVPSEDNPRPGSFTARMRKALLDKTTPLFDSGQPDETSEES